VKITRTHVKKPSKSKLPEPEELEEEEETLDDFDDEE
jgi:hypothetical protein